MQVDLADEASAGAQPPDTDAAIDDEAANQGSFALRKVPVAAVRAWTGVSDIVSSLELKEFAAEFERERQAHQSIEALMGRGRAEAEKIVRRAHQQARALGDTQLKLWQEAFDARQDELSESLGQAVSVVVESVLKNLFGSNADLPVKASIELSMRVLNAELRASALCHPLDLPLVQAQTGRLGTVSLKADEQVQRGQLLFSSEEGEVRVDGQRVIDRLLGDLREVLATKVVTASQ